ncbi:calcium-binding protein [Acuticoccus kandeliae]|uniref:calcium-binding protein n=1 Tax=Acuticoccus kandeliae TaxID=2073160 RepID=UPI000D3E5FF9|nr:calcium-binding protein [Acuticoccus kandeliae]
MASRRTYSDYYDALAYRESSDNYFLESSQGYLGRYQMGEAALEEIGYYSGDYTPQNDYIGTWTGRDGIRSKQHFLENPNVQDQAAREYTEWNWKTLTEYGYDVYAGQVLNGQRMTVSGILGATWLVGFNGMRAYLDSGGLNVAVDGYGTSMLEYLTLFNDYKFPANRFGNSLNEANTIAGGAGDDILFGKGGDDTLIGGEGRDGATYRGAFDEYDITATEEGLIVAHVHGTGVDGTDLLTDFEFLEFTDQTVEVSDFIVEEPEEPENPEPGPGGRDLVGTADDDLLRGGRRGDVIEGLQGNDTLKGGGGDDSMLGGQGDDLVVGAAGDDTLVGGGGRDTLLGGGGDDRIGGSVGADTLKGGQGDDSLAGGASRDFLFGNGGMDTLNGGKGNDVLMGGPGDDVLIGGAGSDRFVFDKSFGDDWIADFDPDADRLDFRRADGIDVADLTLSENDDGDAVLTLDGSTVTLVGVAVSEVDLLSILV